MKYRFDAECLDDDKNKYGIDGYTIKCEASFVNDSRVSESENRPANALFFTCWIDKKIPIIALISTTDIKKRTEILGKYGENYWNNIQTRKYKAEMYNEVNQNIHFKEQIKHEYINDIKKETNNIKPQLMKIEKEYIIKKRESEKIKNNISQLRTKQYKEINEMEILNPLKGNDAYVTCPYFIGHSIIKKNLKSHLAKCPEREYSSVIYAVCDFNYDHIVDKNILEKHHEECPNNPKNLIKTKKSPIKQQKVKQILEDDDDDEEDDKYLRTLFNDNIESDLKSFTKVYIL